MGMMAYALCLVLLSLALSSHAYRFAVVPKRTNSPFFDAVRAGCEARAKRYDNVTCLYTGPSENFNVTDVQIEILTNLLPAIDGFAIAVKNASAISNLIDRAKAMNKHVVTFDSDAVDSERHAYVGTDNYKFGGELAHVLLQLSPDGGKYGIITGGTSPNIKLREAGVRDRLRRSGWVEVENSPGDGKGNSTLALEEMESLLVANPDIGAIVPVGGWPMYDPDGWLAFVERHPQVVTVVADAIEVQIQLMNQGAANGLVGQLPFQMGELAIDTLYELTISQDQGLSAPFKKGTTFATSVLNVLQIPQNLPPLQEEMNYIGSLAILGYVFFGIVALFSIGFAVWTIVYRKAYVVKASQPPFLCMICFGVLIMGSTIIPLSIDDENTSLEGCSKACMSVPWLLSIGFVTTFSALFSKTWRVNQIFQNAARFRRVQVTMKDVIVPFAVLMTLNVIVLLCWTLIAPLQFERRASSGTDNWNRVSRSYYGACYGPSKDEVKGGAIPYVVTLLVINFSVLGIANIQAYHARKIKTDFSESKYVALIMLAMLQSWIVGLPILALVRDSPEAFFVVAAVIIFATCMATLLFLFVPKLTKKAERASARGSSRTTRINSSMAAPSQTRASEVSQVVNGRSSYTFSTLDHKEHRASGQNGAERTFISRPASTANDSSDLLNSTLPEASKNEASAEVAGLSENEATRPCISRSVETQGETEPTSKVVESPSKIQDDQTPNQDDEVQEVNQDDEVQEASQDDVQ